MIEKKNCYDRYDLMKAMENDLYTRA